MPLRTATSRHLPSSSSSTARRIGLVGVAATGVVLVSVLAVPPAASARGADAPVVIGSAVEPATATAYWTTERRAEALDAATASPAQGPTSSSPADSPLEGSLLSTSGAGSPGPSGSGVVRTHAALPYVGELFFVEGGRNRACTATVVHSAEGDVITTAASCLVDHATRLMHPLATFVPGTGDSAAPHGLWPVRLVSSTGAWSRTGAAADDVAFARVEDGSGARVEDETGSAVARFDVPPAAAPTSERLRVLGYPQAAPYLGRQAVGCGAIAHRASGGADGPATIGCAIGDGVTGGPALSVDGLLRSVVTGPADSRGSLGLARWGADAKRTLDTLVVRG